MIVHGPNATFWNYMSRFQQLAVNIVDKYCSMALPYKPGLYSICWESSYRINGLLGELHTAAQRKLLEMRNEASIDLQRARDEFDDIIVKSLMEYTEKIFGSEYPDSEQPEWMMEIARRLHRNTRVTL